MVFIDGENFLLRFQNSLKAQANPKNSIIHTMDRLLWSPSICEIARGAVIRANYYTAYTGDEPALNELRADLKKLTYSSQIGGFNQNGYVHPKVFKKEAKQAKTKSVDVNLTIDVLRAAYTDAIDKVIIVSGDGDYIPLYEEVMRLGKRVFVAAFKNGLNPLVPNAVDQFFPLDSWFFHNPQ